MNNIPGKSFPLGATACPDGVNFSVFAKGGEAAQLLIFDHPDDAQPSRTITFDPVTRDIDSAPGLADTKLIAEAWDAAGLYQVGSFVGDFWKEWNGRFRDDVRSFMKADNDTVTRIPHRLFGSPDIYGRAQREPEQSINFVTCHDGFTLNDLLSYNVKHNEINGENNSGYNYHRKCT